MKATINESGCLRVSAETPLESYALAAWFREYDRTADCKSVLQIETVAEAKPADDRYPNCSKKLQAAGKAYPRTCQECGLLGPCKVPL